MSGKTLFTIDIDRCWGCRTCETACGIEKGTLPTRSGIAVSSREYHDGENPRRGFFPAVCLQCDPAECIASCPVDALRRQPDGTISVISGECIGCGKCVKACPYGAIALERDLTVAVKCDTCRDRRNAGGNPMCVHHCIGGALGVLDDGELEALQGETNVLRRGNVIYTSRKFAFRSDGNL